MVAFLMLGIIPGTNIQITFADWLRLVAIIVGICIVRAIFRKRRIVAILALVTIHRAIKAAKPTPQLA